jgi:hypothetical protein
MKKSPDKLFPSIFICHYPFIHESLHAERVAVCHITVTSNTPGLMYVNLHFCLGSRPKQKLLNNSATAQHTNMIHTPFESGCRNLSNEFSYTAKFQAVLELGGGQACRESI